MLIISSLFYKGSRRTWARSWSWLRMRLSWLLMVAMLSNGLHHDLSFTATIMLASQKVLVRAIDTATIVAHTDDSSHDDSGAYLLQAEDVRLLEGVNDIISSNYLTVEIDSASGGVNRLVNINSTEESVMATSSSTFDTHASPALVLDTVHSTDSHVDVANHRPINPPDVECGIWLAPSTIPGAGLGMYAGRNFHHGDALQLDYTGVPVGDPVIPIVDIEAHNGDKKFRMLWDEYTWRYVSTNLSFDARIANHPYLLPIFCLCLRMVVPDLLTWKQKAW
jgi:hypothetical protein